MRSVHLNEREKHEQRMIFWLLPILIAVVSFAFTAAIAELLTFMWPNLRLYFYLGFFASFISFVGYFSTAHPDSPEKNRSRIPEIFVLVFSSKLYTLFVLPWDEFVTHLQLSRFLEANFIFAFVLIYFAWRLSREAGKLVKTLTYSYIDLEKSRTEVVSTGQAEKENITGKKLVKLLLWPMALLLIGVVIAEQSFQQRMNQAHSLRSLINLFGAILAMGTIAVATMMFYLQKAKEWSRTKSNIDEDLGTKWVIWTLLFLALFSVVAAILPDDLSPVYFYVPDVIKALIPFIHKQGPLPSLETDLVDSPERPEILFPDGEIEVNSIYKYYAAGVLLLRIGLFVLIVGTILYHLVKVAQENPDSLPRLLRKIIESITYLFNSLKNFFKKISPKAQKQRKVVTEQIKDLFQRKKVSYNVVATNEIRRLYGELLIEAEKKGIKRESYKTAHEFGLVLEELFPERIEEIVGLTELYHGARYNFVEPDQVENKKAENFFQKILQSVRGYAKRSN